MRNFIVSELETLLKPAVAALGYEWWGCVLQQQSRRSLLRVYIDKPEGITVDDCAEASYQINGVLAVEAAQLNDYVLEVSSPGMDRPLFTPAQYHRFIGQKIKVRLKQSREEKRNFQGILLGADATHITLQFDAQNIVIAFDDIDRANVVPAF